MEWKPWGTNNGPGLKSEAVTSGFSKPGRRDTVKWFVYTKLLRRGLEQEGLNFGRDFATVNYVRCGRDLVRQEGNSLWLWKTHVYLGKKINLS